MAEPVEEARVAVMSPEFKNATQLFLCVTLCESMCVNLLYKFHDVKVSCEIKFDKRLNFTSNVHCADIGFTTTCVGTTRYVAQQGW